MSSKLEKLEYELEIIENKYKKIKQKLKIARDNVQAERFHLSLKYPREWALCCRCGKCFSYKHITIIEDYFGVTGYVCNNCVLNK